MSKARSFGTSELASGYKIECGDSGVKYPEIVRVSKHDKKSKTVNLLISNGEPDWVKYSGNKLTSSGGYSGKFFLNKTGYVYKFVIANNHCSNIIFTPEG